MKRFIYIISIGLFVLASCTSTRRMSRKFSEKPEVITSQFSGERYANKPADSSRDYARIPLWNQLAMYRPEKDSLPEIHRNAEISLSLEKNNMLKVIAYQDQEQLDGFEIPVRKRGKYLILENKTRVIPIPIIYFEVKESKEILAPLKNNRIGIHGYSDHTLWILFFGASSPGRSINEYERIDKMEGR